MALVDIVTAPSNRMHSLTMAFNAEVKDFAQRVVPNEALALERRMALEGLRRLVKKTPVDTGRARGNWQVGIEQDPAVALVVTDREGEATIAAGAAQIAAMRLGTCYITNNVVYIEALEHGHSKQAPYGMLAVTVEELKSLFP